MKKNRGFTLIEILLVIAIIGILAAVTFAMIGNSDNARLKAVMTTAKSVLTYAQECQFNKEELTPPPINANGAGSDDPICVGSTSQWPELSVDDCVYSITDDYTYEVDCTAAGITDKKIQCNATDGSCREVDIE